MHAQLLRQATRTARRALASRQPAHEQGTRLHAGCDLVVPLGREDLLNPTSLLDQLSKQVLTAGEYMTNEVMQRIPGVVGSSS